MERSGYDWDDCLVAYLKAWNHTPQRAEPLFRIGANYHDMGNLPLAKLFLSQAASLEVPKNLILFIEDSVYTYISAFYAGSASEKMGQWYDAVNFYNLVIANAPIEHPLYLKAKQNIATCKEQMDITQASAA